MRSSKCLTAIVEPIFNPLVFKCGISTVDQSVLQTQNIENCFDAKGHARAVFEDLISAYDTVCKRRLTCKLLRIKSNKDMIGMIMELFEKRSIILTTDSGKQSRLPRMAFHRELSWPLCYITSIFTIYHSL